MRQDRDENLKTVTETQSQQHIQPRLSQIKRDHVSNQSLYKIFNYVIYKLYTGCQWSALPIEHTVDGQPVMPNQVPYHHFRKWSADGSLQRQTSPLLMSHIPGYGLPGNRWHPCVRLVPRADP